MGMEVLRCKTPKMIHKELEMFLIAYNLIRPLSHAAQSIVKEIRSFIAELAPAYQPIFVVVRILRDLGSNLKRNTRRSYNELKLLPVGNEPGFEPLI
jgi:hypothetical protein